MLWLIMSFIPDEWIKLAIHAMVLFGIAVYFGSGLVRFLTKRWLTSLPQLMLLIKILGISLFITGVFFEGGYGVEMEWRAKVAEMQLKVAKAEADSAQANLKIIEVPPNLLLKEKVKNLSTLEWINNLVQPTMLRKCNL